MWFQFKFQGADSGLGGVRSQQTFAAAGQGALRPLRHSGSLIRLPLTGPTPRPMGQAGVPALRHPSASLSSPPHTLRRIDHLTCDCIAVSLLGTEVPPRGHGPAWGHCSANTLGRGSQWHRSPGKPTPSAFFRRSARSPRGAHLFCHHASAGIRDGSLLETCPAGAGTPTVT